MSTPLILRNTGIKERYHQNHWQNHIVFRMMLVNKIPQKSVMVGWFFKAMTPPILSKVYHLKSIWRWLSAVILFIYISVWFSMWAWSSAPIIIIISTVYQQYTNVSVTKALTVLTFDLLYRNWLSNRWSFPQGKTKATDCTIIRNLQLYSHFHRML